MINEEYVIKLKYIFGSVNNESLLNDRQAYLVCKYGLTGLNLEKYLEMAETHINIINELSKFGQSISDEELIQQFKNIADNK